jgi:hypothetical protein
MSLLRASTLQYLLVRRQFSQLPSILGAQRFKSTDGKDGEKLETDKLKLELEELTKKLDENLKERPKETEQELEKDFMNFRRVREVSYWWSFGIWCLDLRNVLIFWCCSWLLV